MQTDFKKTNKKVGILTFHFAHNFGASLQAYALQKALNNFCNCKIVNYCPEYHTKIFKYPKDKMPLERAKSLYNSLPKNPISFLRAVKYYFQAKKYCDYKFFQKNYKKYEKFFKKIKLTKKCDSINGVKNISNSFDALVVGSDQLWNKSLIGGVLDKVYFADIEGYAKEKFTYAVSAGNSLENADLEYVKNQLQEFKSVSVREKGLKEQLKENGIDTRLDLDPTFLLEKLDYEKIETEVDIKEKYIFLYGVCLNKEIIITLTELQKKYGYVIIGTTYLFNNKDVDFRYIYISCNSPCEFLYLIHNAELVVTGSFHGTVFSIIYNKKFLSLTPFDGKDRLTTLLSELNLEEHAVWNNKICLENNYEQAYEIIKQKREDALKYLKEIAIYEK